MELKGGVLMIGSLYWQDYLNEGDTNRRDWRDDALIIDKAISISVPIRYGRFSTGESYTMIFDKELDEAKYGIAKAVPFNKTISSIDEIISQTKAMSKVEGHNNKLIKGSIKPAWGVCGIIFNPNINPEEKESILSAWEHSLKENPAGYTEFISKHNNYSLSNKGEFLFDFPSEASKLDFLIAISTKPENKEGIEYLTVEEIAIHVKNRDYFYPNIKHGITTFQDDDIKSLLNK